MRMSKHAAWVLPLMLFSGAVVHAQCRIGSGPNHGDGIPWCSQPQQPAKRLPPVQWAEQWGAIAYGGGAFGEAKEMATVNDAQNAALNACQDSGGGQPLQGSSVLFQPMCSLCLGRQLCRGSCTLCNV